MPENMIVSFKPDDRRKNKPGWNPDNTVMTRAMKYRLIISGCMLTIFFTGGLKSCRICKNPVSIYMGQDIFKMKMSCMPAKPKSTEH